MERYNDKLCWKQAFRLQERGVEAWLNATQLECVGQSEVSLKRLGVQSISVSGHGVALILASHSVLILDLKLRRLGSIWIEKDRGARVELTGPFILLNSGSDEVDLYSFAKLTRQPLASFKVHSSNMSWHAPYMPTSQQQLEENFMLLQMPEGDIQEIFWDSNDGSTVHIGPLYLSGIKTTEATRVCGDQHHVLGSYFVRPDQCALVCWERGNPVPLWTFSKTVERCYKAGSVDILGSVVLFGTDALEGQLHLLDVETATVLSELSAPCAWFLLTPIARTHAIRLLRERHSLDALPSIPLYHIRTMEVLLFSPTICFSPAILKLRHMDVEPYRLPLERGTSMDSSLYFDGVVVQWHDKTFMIHNLADRTSVAIPLEATNGVTPMCAISNNRELLAMLKPDGFLRLYRPVRGDGLK